ncbi:hypothetical protein WEI85_12470 [Actinomycetes bacterium KLBMP 9797]
MTKRVTVSLPDDVAAYLETFRNASAAVTQALRAQMNRGPTTEAMLRAIGFNITEEGKARVRASMPRFTAEQRAEIRRRRDLVRARKWQEEGRG